MKKNKDKTFVDIRVLLVEGRTRQVMPMMESLRKLGCYVVTHNVSRLDMGYASHYPNKRVLGFCDPSDEERSYKSILKTVIDHKIDLIIPLNDFVAILLSKRKVELSKYCKVATNDWEIFQNASDKLKTMAACMSNNIPCPKTILVDKPSPSDIKLNSMSFPLVIKPRTGFSAVGFRTIDNDSNIEEILAKTFEKYGPYLIQEYIPQTDLQYKAELYVDNDGNLKSACVFAKIRWYPINGGSSTMNVTVERPDIIENCKRLLEAIGWRGYADIDLIQD